MTTLKATGEQTMLADVTEFRTFVGAADQAEALAAIFIAGVGAGYSRPCAILTTAPGGVAERFGGGGRDYFSDPNLVWVVFEGEDVDPDDVEESLLSFLNSFGAIVSGIERLSGQGYPWLRGWEMDEASAPRRPHQDEPDDYFCAAIALNRGIG
jgi:hypothetical protein